MKSPFLLGALVLAAAADVEAKCAADGLWAWPENKLPSDGRIILTAYARSQTLLEKLEDGDVRLVSTDHSVSLQVEEVIRGQYSLTQAVLRTKEALRVGTSYRLFVGSRSLGGYEIHEPDRVPPEWSSAPKLGSQESEQYGCGPSNLTAISTSLIDESAVTVRVELLELENKNSANFFVHPEIDQIQIGHGMCSGGFAPKSGRRYRAKLTAVDASGLSAPAAVEIDFVAP
jgi:hypothetical protein